MAFSAGKPSRFCSAALLVLLATSLLTLLAVPIARVYATTIIGIAPSFGARGTTVTLTGLIDTPGGPCEVYFNHVLIAAVNADGAGHIVVTITVPFNAPMGTVPVTIRDPTAGTFSSTSFTVTALVDLLVAGAWVTPPNPKTGDQVSFTARIGNAGPDPGVGVPVHWPRWSTILVPYA